MTSKATDPVKPPYIHFPDAADAKRLFHALVAAGFTMDIGDFPDTPEGVDAYFVKYPDTYVVGISPTRTRGDGIDGWPKASASGAFNESTLTNSIPHFLHHARRYRAWRANQPEVS